VAPKLKPIRWATKYSRMKLFKNILSRVGFEVFTAVVLKCIFFCCLLAGLLNYSSTLKMEAISSSETSGTPLRTTWRHIPEEDTLQHTVTFLSDYIRVLD
jgi:hypothetical protein